MWWREEINACLQTGLLCHENCDVQSRTTGDCSAYSRAKSALATFFKLNSFHLGQLEVFASPSPSGCVCQDGNWCLKVLVFYIFPLALGSLAVGIVINPLNALMDQQVTHSVGVIFFPIDVYLHRSFTWCFSIKSDQ